MPFLDYLVLIIFSFMVILVGMSFTGKTENMNSFFAAGGNLPWWLSGLSLFMSFFSAGTFVVWGSIAYEYGWVAITIQWMMGLGGFLIAMFIAPRWNEANILTVGQYISNRFGQNTQKFYSYIFLLLSFITTGAFLYPVAKLFNVSTGFSIELSVIGIGILVVLYTTAGGLWAVIITDVLQFVILFAAVLMVVPLAFNEIGGLNSFINKTPEGFFNFISGEYSLGFLIAFALYNTIFIGGNWAYVQRYTSVSSPKEASKVALLFGSLYMFSPILWMIPPMILRAMGGELEGLENEGAFLLICKQVLPQGLLGLMLGGMIFATASSVNTTLNMSSAVFTHDIFRRLVKKVQDQQLMWVARISTAVFGVITIGVALLVPAVGGIVEVVLSVGAITGVPLFAPPIWALFSTRQNSRSILYTTLISLGINLFFKFASPYLFDFALDRAEEMLVGALTPFFFLGLFEIFPLNKHDSALDIENSSLDQTLTELPPTDENQFALKVLSYALFATSALILILGFMAEAGRSIVWIVGSFILLISFYIYKKFV